MVKPTANSKEQIANSSPKTSGSSGAKTMAELMAKSQSSIVTLQKGQIVKGVITKLTSSEIFVDLGSKTHAMVLEKDRRIFRSIMGNFKVGDQVEVSVLSPESEFGFPVVSMRRFLDDMQWKKMGEIKDKRQTIPVTINSKTMGGYLVTTEDGVAGFLPNSQAQISDDSANKKIDVYILELARETKKVIFSQKPQMDKAEFEKVASKFKIGESIKGKVTTVTSFGLFVNAQKDGASLDGLVHISEISWEKTEDQLGNFAQGQEVEVKIIGIDKESKRLDLSIKQLTSDPFAQAMKEYAVDQKVTGEVTKVLSNGVSIRFENGVEGFIRKDKIPPTISFEEGQEIEATIVDIDAKKHRLNLAPVLKAKPIGYR